MTYSQTVKEELCTAKFSCEECSYAFVYAMLLFRECDDGILFQSDCRHIIDLLAQKIVEQTGVIATILTDQKDRSKKHRIYRLAVEPTEDVSEFYKRFEQALRFRFDEKASFLKKDCCKSAFLRGVFLSCGVLVNPTKEYHFEFKLRRARLAEALNQFLLLTGLEFKYTVRKGNSIFYLKGSEQIEEVLTYMGAYKTALELMNIKILKEVRNKVNRVINCETANIEKTVKASMKQVDDIQFIIRKKGMDFLSDDLQEIAKARLENTELSLTELLKVIPSGISRSSLNRRFYKLTQIAEELRTESNQN